MKWGCCAEDRKEAVKIKLVELAEANESSGWSLGDHYLKPEVLVSMSRRQSSPASAHLQNIKNITIEKHVSFWQVIQLTIEGHWIWGNDFFARVIPCCKLRCDCILLQARTLLNHRAPRVFLDLQGSFHQAQMLHHRAAHRVCPSTHSSWLANPWERCVNSSHVVGLTPTVMQQSARDVDDRMTTRYSLIVAVVAHGILFGSMISSLSMACGRRTYR